MNNKSRNSFFKRPISWLSALGAVDAGPGSLRQALSPPLRRLRRHPAPAQPPPSAAASEAHHQCRYRSDLGQGPPGGLEGHPTLYMFTKDVPHKSNCAAGCLKAWPALLTMGSPTRVPSAWTLRRSVGPAMPDGTKIVTYNHMPLYYYAKDTKAGDTTGQ